MPNHNRSVLVAGTGWSKAFDAFILAFVSDGAAANLKMLRWLRGELPPNTLLVSHLCNMCLAFQNMSHLCNMCLNDLKERPDWICMNARNIGLGRLEKA